MIPQIRKYLASKGYGELTPMIRSNPNYNTIEYYPQLARVVFWFDGYDYPKIITKITDDSLGIDSIKRCISYQNMVNDLYGRKLYAYIYDVTNINSHNVIIEESIKDSTYERYLVNAIRGAGRSQDLYRRTLLKLFREMAELCSIYQDIIPDLVCPNIFPGPIFIDNIVPDIELLRSKLKPDSNAYRFIITCLYSLPMTDIYSDWVKALAIAVNDRKRNTILSQAVWNIFDGIGVIDVSVIWNKLLEALQYEINDKPNPKPKLYTKWIKQFYKYKKTIDKYINHDYVINAESKLNNQDETQSYIEELRQHLLFIIPPKFRNITRDIAKRMLIK